MSEPTKEAIEEARELYVRFGTSQQISGNVVDDPYVLTTFSHHQLANIIAHVRKQAREDALERAAQMCDLCESTSPVKQRQIAAAQIAARLRALKTQGDAQ